MKKKLIAMVLVFTCLLNCLLTGCSIYEKPSKMETPPVVVLEKIDYLISGYIKPIYSNKARVYKFQSVNVNCYGTASEAMDNPKQFGLKDWKYYSGLGYDFRVLELQLLLKNVTKVRKVTPMIITGPDKAKIEVHTKLEIDDIYRSTINISVPENSSSLYKVLFEVTYQQEDSLEHCFFAISFYEPK